MHSALPRGHRRYRELAEESRKKAAAAEDYILRRSYLRLAETCEKLGKSIAETIFHLRITERVVVRRRGRRAAIPPDRTGVIFIEKGALDPAPPGSATVNPNRTPSEPRTPSLSASAGSLMRKAGHADSNKPPLAVAQFDRPTN